MLQKLQRRKRLTTRHGPRQRRSARDWRCSNSSGKTRRARRPRRGPRPQTQLLMNATEENSLRSVEEGRIYPRCVISTIVDRHVAPTLLARASSSNAMMVRVASSGALKDLDLITAFTLVYDDAGA